MEKVLSPDIFARLNSNHKSDNHFHLQLDNRDASRIPKTFSVDGGETCRNCGSANFSQGAGLKPGQMSLKCSECKTFIGYRNVEKLRRLQKLRRRERLDLCIDFLEKCGITAVDEIIFILSEIGGAL